LCSCQVGCAAGFLNSVKIKGSHTALKVSRRDIPLGP
jgi:flavin-dependent dehydrogenase